MKKGKLFISVLIGTVFFGITEAKAASVSISASSNYVTNGNKVTFYININGAASWTLQGSGIGATSGCSLGDDRVGDSGTGKNANRTITATCLATNVGQIAFSVSGSVWDENFKEVAINTTKAVTVTAPRQKDTNNDLNSLKIGNYKLSPEFNKNTLEYSVDVPSTVDKITIEATKASNYSSLEGIGEKEVNEGANLFEITVTSETGEPKTYKVTVNVKDENPISVKVNDSNYTLIKNAKNLIKPDTFENTTITINKVEIPAFYNKTLNITLVGVKDNAGKTILAIYDKEKNTYEPYQEIKSNQMILLIKKIPDQKENGIPSKVKIEDQTYECLKYQEDSEFSIVYATNIVTGKSDYYIYDSKEQSFIRYNEEQTRSLKLELEKYKNLIIYFAGGFLLAILIIMILLIRRPKKKRPKHKMVPEAKVESEEKMEVEEKEPEKEPSKSKKKKERRSRNFKYRSTRIARRTNRRNYV